MSDFSDPSDEEETNTLLLKRKARPFDQEEENPAHSEENKQTGKDFLSSHYTSGSQIPSSGGYSS